MGHYENAESAWDDGDADAAAAVSVALSAEYREELESLAAGYEASDYAETLLLVALQPHIDAFHAGDRSDKTMRQLRISNDARANARRSRKSAAAIRAALSLLSAPGDS